MDVPNASNPLLENKTLPTASILAPNRVLMCSSPTFIVSGKWYTWLENIQMER